MLAFNFKQLSDIVGQKVWPWMKCSSPSDHQPIICLLDVDYSNSMNITN